MRHLLCALAACVLLVPASAFAADSLREESTGIAFEGAPTVDGVAFRCLGTGLRKKFVVKVYAVAFCLEASKAQETMASAAAKAGNVDEDNQVFFNALAESSVAKLVDMRFVHDVDKEKIVEAFTETLDKSLGRGKDPDARAKFLALVDRDIKKGDRVTLSASAEGKLTLTIAGNAGSVVDPPIAHAIWGAWIGHDSVTPALKKSLAHAAK